MGEATIVSVPLDSTPPSGPDKPEVAPVESQQTTERPAWLPEKFKSAEDLAKAYSELETKLGAKPTEDGKPLEVPKPTEKPAVDPVALAREEFATKGELSEETYKSLAGKGLSKEVVDGYIEGVRAQAARAEAELLSDFGGREAFDEMAKWAAENVAPEEVEALNGQLAAGGAQAKLALKTLKALHTAATGGPGKLIEGDGVFTTGGSTYMNFDEVVADMQKPEYQTSERFRAQVAAKLQRSRV